MDINVKINIKLFHTVKTLTSPKLPEHKCPAYFRKLFFPLKVNNENCKRNDKRIDMQKKVKVENNIFLSFTVLFHCLEESLQSCLS